MSKSDRNVSDGTSELSSSEHSNSASGEPSKRHGGSRRSAIIAALALVAVLVGGGIAYRALAPVASSQNGGDVQVSSSTESDAARATSSSGAESDASPDSILDANSTVYDASGNAVTLSDIADGNVLVINYWATWCPNCVEEFSDYQDLYNQYGGRVVFAFIDCTDGKRETVQKANDFITSNGYDLPVYYDFDGSFGLDYQVEYLPTSLIVDRDGSVAWEQIGRIDPKILSRRLDRML